MNNIRPNNDLSLQEFTVAITGSWINPETNNKYIFTPDPKTVQKKKCALGKMAYKHLSLCALP